MSSMVGWDDLRTLTAIVALLISLFSMWLTIHLWLRSNRPVVTAFIDEHQSGSATSAFNLVIANTGNRPALDVRLRADPLQVRRLFKHGVSQDFLREIEVCFTEEACVAVLRNGENLETAFGHYSGENGQECLEYGAQIDIKIIYRDLDGRKYSSVIPLKVYVRRGFGGAVWGEAEKG